MVIPSFVISIIILAIGIWASMKLESTMNNVTENQLLIEPSKFSYKMWKDMPVTMYQSFTFFNLTNWNQVKSVGQKPRFVEVGPYVYKTIWTKSEINFLDDEKMINFAEKKQWIFQPLLSKGYEDDLIWTINTPLMTALALIQNAPVITRNIVSVILDGLGEGAFIKRNIKSLLFDGYSDLIVSVGPLFDRRFANFNGKFAYLYNKNDSVDGYWTVSTGTDDLSSLNKITRFQSNIVNMTTHSSGQMPQGLNEVKQECAQAWSLDHATNGQLFAPFNKDLEQYKLQQQLDQLSTASKSIQQRSTASSNQQTINSIAPQAATGTATTTTQPPPPPISKRFFSRSVASSLNHHHHHQQQQQQLTNNKNHLNHAQELVSNPFITSNQQKQLRNVGKFIFYPDLCRPIHLLPSKQQVYTSNGIQASRYFIDPKVFMNSTQVPTNKCFEMNPRPPLANTLAATINSVTGANVAMPNLVVGASSPFAMFASAAGGGGGHQSAGSSSPLSAIGHHHGHHLGHLHHGLGSLVGGHQNNNNHHDNNGGLFERSNHNPATTFINNALQTLAGAAGQNQLAAGQDQMAASSSANGGAPISRLGRVRQLFSNIVSQRMSVASPGGSLSLLPTALTSGGPASMLIGANHHHHHHHHQPLSLAGLSARNSSPEDLAAKQQATAIAGAHPTSRQHQLLAEQGSQSVPTIQALPQTDPSLMLGPLSPALQQQSQLSTPASAASGLGPDASLAVAGLSNSNSNEITSPPQLGQPQQQHQQRQPLPLPAPPPPPPVGGSDRWITQFRFKWPRGVFSIGQCQLGAPIYASLPHFLDADEYYLEQVDGLKPNRSLHEFYIDIESRLHSIPVGAKARLQLNVATPELRFRNIPNAMIPVLWQEVTFNIDKPIATMLYWSFTMSSTIYKVITILILTIGSLIFISSFVQVVKRHTNDDANNRRSLPTTKKKNRVCCSSSTSTTKSSSNETLQSTTSSSEQVEQQHRVAGSQLCGGQVNQEHEQQGIVGGGGPNVFLLSNGAHHQHHHHLQQQQQHSWLHPHLNQQQRESLENQTTRARQEACTSGIGDGQCQLNENMELNNHHGRAALEHSGFAGPPCHYNFSNNNNQNKKLNNREQTLEACSGSSQTSATSYNNNNNLMRQQQLQSSTNGPIMSASSGSSSSSSPSSSSASSHSSIGAMSPKQPSSRASSNCELVSSFNTSACNGHTATTTTIGNGCNATAAFNCPGCLLACLRHSTPNSNNIHDHNNLPTTTTSSSDNNIVRHHHDTLCNKNHFQQHNLKHHILQLNQAEMSDIDKATLSSRNSSTMDSCSPIYNNNNIDSRTSSFK